MTPSPSSPDGTGSGVVSPPSVPYGTGAFQQRLDELLDDGRTGNGVRVLFYGGPQEKRQEALGTLTRHENGNVHQFRVPSLLNEYRMQTQNSLRKAFDHAAEERALLYFDEIGSLVAHDHADASEDSAQTAAPTATEYFSDRVDAYPEVVVLGLARPQSLDWAAGMVDLVVRFE
jgi:SpoVK/Ycf46/Vps4 family AAA+-type ATPase